MSWRSEDVFCNAPQKLFLRLTFCLWTSWILLLKGIWEVQCYLAFLCVRLRQRKGNKSSSSDDTIIEALGMAEGLAEKVHLILAKLSKAWQARRNWTSRFNNLSTSVSSIEMSMGQLEKEVSVLDIGKNQDHQQVGRRVGRKLWRRYFRFKKECLRHCMYRNWSLPIGAFQDQFKQWQINIQINIQ